MRTGAKIAGACLAFALAGASHQASGQQQDCSVKAQRYAQLATMESGCRQGFRGPSDPVYKDCEARIRVVRAKLDSLFANCSAGGGSKTPGAATGSTPVTPGPITAGYNAPPASQALANSMNGVLGVMQANQDAQRAQDAQRDAAAAQARKEEREKKEADEARAEAADAAKLVRKNGEMSALAATFNLAPESTTSPDPMAGTREARDICRAQGSYIQTMNPDRFNKLCPPAKAAPPPPLPLPSPVGWPVTAPPTNKVWSAKACFDYSKQLHAALVAVAHQHDDDIAACNAAVAVDPPVALPASHSTTVHAAGITAVATTMDALSATALATINAENAKPMAQRSGCTQHLETLTAATSAASLDANRRSRMLSTTPPPSSNFPPEQDQCQQNEGPLLGMSSVSTSPDVEGVCRAVEAYWKCKL